MAGLALDVTTPLSALASLIQTNWHDSRSETDTASILLELRVVQTLLQGQCACPRLVLGAILISKYRALLLFDLGFLGQLCIFGERDPTHYIGERPKFWVRWWW